MDFGRRSDIYQTDLDIPTNFLLDPADGHAHQSSEHGAILDSDDDLSLGSDARVFSTSGSEPLVSPGGSSQSTGYNFESSSESTGYPGSHRIFKKLDHVGRLNSTESSVSDLSDFSRTSHDVSSLLDAMTVDPEEFLADLGFAEADMRMRIPDRFLESPSKAQGIDVELFRRSLDQDDVYGSPSQESPVWSDPGSSRIPLRFIAPHTEPIDTVFIGGCSSIPLISEPEEVPEDSFDLMRHLRLNKPQHVTKGMFLEPVTEELEVSSVGSGTIRTRISRKLSNEGTIVREESLEQVNLEPELLLNVPATSSEQTGFDLNETKEATVVEKDEDVARIVVNLDAEEGTSVSVSEGVVLDYAVKSSDSVVNSSICSTKGYPCSDVPAHLKVSSIEVQDSFELEEIGNEEYNEKETSASTDQEASLIVKPSEKRLTRENSGESSGFEEMLPDKETGSPNSSSPVLNTKVFSSVTPVLVSDRRPLEALLDPEMLSLAVEEKSPRATFGQRRTKSLTKQRPIDEDTFASWAFSPRSSAAKFVSENLGTSVSHEDSTMTSGFEDTGSNFLAVSTQEPMIEFMKSNLDSYVGETDENCNTTSKFEPRNMLVTVELSELEEGGSSLGNRGTEPIERFENEMQVNGDCRAKQQTSRERRGRRGSKGTEREKKQKETEPGQQNQATTRERGSDSSLGKQGAAPVERFENEMQVNGDLLSLQGHTDTAICNTTSNFEHKDLLVTVEPSELEEGDSSLGKQEQAQHLLKDLRTKCKRMEMF
ncbi:hypothetical protein ACROYT_G034604 [Oculina patagonica]